MMIRILTFLLILIYGIPFVFSQSLISERIVQNEVSYNISASPITSDYPIRFSSIEPTIEGVWNVEVLNTSGTWHNVYESSDIESWCVFDPQAIKWNIAKRGYDEDINRDFFYCKIVFISNNITDELCFNLAILPERPIIENVRFAMEYEWESECPSLVQSLLELDVLYANSNTLYLCFDFKDGSAYHTSEKPRTFRFIETMRDVSNSVDGLTSFDVKNADWGECFTVFAENKYGMVSCMDTLNTTEFVVDPLINNYINDYWSQQSGVEENSWDELAIDTNMIICSDSVKELSIFNFNGTPIGVFYNPEKIMMSNYSKGIYIILYRTISDHLKTIKYIKI